MTALSEDGRRPTKVKAPRKQGSSASASPGSGSDDVAALKEALQEQRRALTLLNAEAEKQREAREALEMQLIEANAEIVASWDRRKEMARVIADRDREIKMHRTRRKEMAQVIDQLKADLKLRYEELAALQRHISHSTLQGRTNRLFRRVRKLFG